MAVPEPRPRLDDLMRMIMYRILNGVRENTNIEIIMMYVTSFLVLLVISRGYNWETW